MTPTDPEIDLQRPDCGEAIAALHQFLDGEAVTASAAVVCHRVDCRACREEWQLARLIRRPAPAVIVPIELTAKTERAVRRDRTRRRFQRWTAATVAATAAAVIGVAFWPAREPTPINNPVIAIVAAGPSAKEGVEFDASLSDARSAMASLSDKVIPDRPDVTLPPIVLPKVEPMTQADPAWDRLADAGNGLKTGVKPLAASARRAVTMLFRSAETFSAADAPLKN